METTHEPVIYKAATVERMFFGRTRLVTSLSKLKLAECNKDEFLLLLFHQSSTFLHKRDINNRRGERGTLFFSSPHPFFLQSSFMK